MRQNLNSIAYSGTIPQFYDALLGPLYFQPYAEYIGKKIAELRPATILELACGTGRLTHELLQRIPDVKITATDINPSMLEHARSVVKHSTVEWKIVDAVELPFPSASFDVVAVQFGVMFYSDKIKAFTATYDVLKPAGTFVFSAWDALEHNPVAAITQSVIKDFFPEDTPPFYQVPFAYNDPQMIEHDLRSAGFQHIEIGSVKLKGHCSSAAEAAKGLLEGTPAHTAIMERDASLLIPMEHELEKRLVERYGSSSFGPELQAFVITAKK